VRAGRFAEARDLLKGLSRTPNSPVMSLVTTAALEGVDAAVRQSERDYQDDKDRATALHQAGQNMIVLRRYPDAAALFERASRQSENAASLLATADVLRRSRRYEELDLPTGDPATVVRRLMKMVFVEERDVRRLASLFQRETEEEIVRVGDAFLNAFEAGFSRVTRQLQASNLPLDAALDLGLGAMRVTVSGDDTLGYRLAVTSAMESGRSQRFFVVRQGKEYRIAGLSGALVTLGIETLRRAKQGDLTGARQLLDWTLDEMSAAKRDDDGLPLHPFLALWTRGSAAGAEEIRCAAAALWSYESEVSPEVPGILLPCREAATDPARRNALDLALIATYGSLERYPEMEQVTRRLLAAVPDSERAEDLHLNALTSQSRWDEARGIAERRLQSTGDHEGALRLLFRIAYEAGEVERAQERFQRLVDTGKASAGDYNHMAWMLLIQGRVDDKTVEYAQRAVTLSDYGNPAHLHTLASIYAEMGKTGEAYQLLVQSLAAKADDTPDGDDWYVVGRLAEHYGLPDVARKCYKRVDPPAKASREALSTHALASRRLAALDSASARVQARPAGSRGR
jgi:tetratricopeptide (TPR) repeat protein